MPILLPLLLSLTTATLYAPTTPHPLSDPPLTDAPFGTRLFLTPHHNYLNLVWTCHVPEGQVIANLTNTKIQLSYRNGSSALNVTIESKKIRKIFKEDVDGMRLGNYNVTVELRLNKTLFYRVYCGDRQSELFEVKYKYWDQDQNDVWTMLAVGSLGLYNTTNVSLGIIREISDNVKNVLWALPGGIIADHTVMDGSKEPTEVTWRKWLSWLLLVDNITCCIPLVASPSLLDLFPYNGSNLESSNYRHFLELPFQSPAHEVLWYSFDHRNLHVISVCMYCSLSVGSVQYRWLEADMKKAQNSTTTHWTMVMGHESLYSTQESSDPSKLFEARKQLDKLFDIYNVDYAIWSHERLYERSKPMRNGKVSDTRVSNSLENVNGTIHYTCGTGGIPLQYYNMDKYHHTANYEYRYYGVCSFDRITDHLYETMFIYRTKENVMKLYDNLQLIKKKFEKSPVLFENHFAKFMKIFGIVIVGGAVLMLLVILVLKLFQKFDPAHISSKIRNFSHIGRNPQGSSIRMSCDDMDVGLDPEVDERDRVMLLEEEAPQIQIQTFGVEAAIGYR